MITDEEVFVLIPFNTFIGEEQTETEAERDVTQKVEWENVDGLASVKEKQNIKKESVIAEAPPLSLQPLIDNLDADNKASLHLGKSLPRRNRIGHLLKLIEASPHIHLK